jgi:cysteine desulfuration protein SufE
VTIVEKQRQLTATLTALKTPQDRLAYAVQRGRAAPALEAALRTEAYRVEGCMARAWFVAEFSGGACHFRADSESAIVKGIAVLLCEFYSGHAPAEILQTSPVFLEKLGITQHLTPNRRNSLGKIWKGIESFARSHLGQ